MPDPFVLAEKVTKTYATDVGTVEALHETDVAIPCGALTAVAGVSGSGKSTLLRLVAGLERASAGRLLVDGLELASLRPKVLRRFRRDGVSFVAQQPAANLVPHLTLAEHAHDPGAAEIFERFGLGHRLGARPAQLSGGELARAAFAAALARRTPLVVSDEPTAELDRETARHLLAAMREQCAAGATVVVATHDDDVLALADHVVRLERRLGGTVPDGGAGAAPAGRGETIVRVVGLSKSFRTTHAVAGASFELRAGELSVVAGRSGSGKSTLLMLLGGWQRPDGGTIETELSQRWQEIAYVPQRFGLVPELTIRENVELPARLGGRGDVLPEVDALLAALDLDELAERYPHESSIGQQQRAALARGLAITPRLLLVDEPTSHQDPVSRERVWSLLRRVVDRGTCCFVATHEPDAAVYAHAAWEIHEGRMRPAGEHG